MDTPDAAALHALAEQVRIGISLVHVADPDDPEGWRIVFNNAAASEAARADVQRFVGMGFLEALPAVRGTPVVDLYARAVREQTEIELPEIVYGDTNVPEAAFRGWLTPLPGNLVMGQYQDVTEQRRVEGELRRSNAILERFASIVSHDLQAPLRRLVGYVEMMADEQRDGLSEKGEMLQERVINNATRLQALVRDLLDYARNSTSDVPPQTVDPKETLALVLDDLGAQIEDAAARVEVGDLAPVLVNPEALGLVFQNLVENGIRYRSSRPPVVTVQSVVEGDTVRFTVADNGLGFGPHEAERLFELGYRGNTGIRQPGCGIGLALVKLLVEDWGGSVWAESTPAAGARFHFTVSRAE